MFKNLIKKIIKIEKSEDSYEELFNIDIYNISLYSIIDAIDTKNIEDIKKLSKEINENNK